MAEAVLEHSDTFQPKFQVNMRIIADELERQGREIRFYGSDQEDGLDGVKLAFKKGTVKRNYVYLFPAGEASEWLSDSDLSAAVMVGRTERSVLPHNVAKHPEPCAEGTFCRIPVIQIAGGADFFEVFDQLQQIFEKYREWEWALCRALGSPRPLDDILLASMEIFRNPMFIHDANFFVVSAPRHVEEMPVWEIDPRTGRRMVPMSIINDFRVDVEYLEGLGEKGVVLFSAEQRGYRILYRNLWNQNRYVGRILIDEIEGALAPGDNDLLDYLGRLVETCILKKELFWVDMGNNAEQFFTSLLNEELQDQQKIMNYLQFLKWNRNDTYLCLCIITDQKDFNMLSASATLGQIDAQIPAGYAFVYKGSIVAIVNLTYAGTSAKDVLSRLAITLREGLLKTGVSSEINDFLLISKSYRQAYIALEMGRSGSSTNWCYYFQDYMLDYMISSASQEVPVRMLCDDALRKLQEYDEENHAEMYQTLLVYLRQERNMLRTARALFIHRSTLSYRLERIRKITGMNLDDVQVRLRLLLSYYMAQGML